MSKYCAIAWSVVIGNLIKVKAWFEIMCLNRVKLSDKVEKGLIVSLTSYGKRVTNNSVSYTLHSLLTQKVRAERIILWLDEDHFSDETLPTMLKRIKKFGVEVFYCQDWRSYKKLLPTLMRFPNYDVITADDDLYYSSHYLEDIINTHHKSPEDVVMHGMRVPEMTDDGGFRPYKEWKTVRNVGTEYTYNHYLVIPLGGYGAYYPAGIFDSEVLNYSVISQLCPHADDIWFYIMGLRKHTRKILVKGAKSTCYQLDLIRQHFQRDRLYAINVSEDENDSQLHKLLDYYHLQPTDFFSLDEENGFGKNSKSLKAESERSQS